MNDLISRQAAINAVCMEWCGVKHQDCEHPFDVGKDDYYWCDGCETALRTLPDLPSAEPEKVCIARINLSEEQVREAVEKAKSEIVQVLPSAQPEIIHCKECKFAHMTVGGECKYCDIWFPGEKTYMPGDYFCGSAERRTDD